MAASNGEVSRLLVLGPDADSKHAVVAKLQQLCGDLEPEAQDASKDDVAVLNLQTKYYRASVEVHVHQVRDNAPQPVLQHDLHDYEALVCVVDAGQRESFLHLHRFAKRVVDTLPYDVCLLVADTASATKENVRKMESWCQDNGFEFVDLDAEQTSSDDDVIDEKHGIERVLEALHCNMWRSMEMNPPEPVDTNTTAREKDVTPGVKAVETEKKAAAREEKSENQEEKSGNQEKKENSGDADQEGASTDDSRLQALLQALEIAGGPGDVSTDEDENDDDEDIDMTQFSALISEVRNVRDQGEFLTDEQRRERAAEVAMKLWNFLGADDSDSASD